LADGRWFSQGRKTGIRIGVRVPGHGAGIPSINHKEKTMTERVEQIETLAAIIRRQRDEKPSKETVTETLRMLKPDELIEYTEFLEKNHQIRLSRRDGKYLLEKLGVDNPAFVEEHANNFDALTLRKLERLLEAKADRLVDTYLHVILPDKMLNDFVICKANKLNHSYMGRYKNALDMITLGVALNSVPFEEGVLERFFEIEKKYFQTGEPQVDINTFFKLTIPVLKRISLKRGPEAFYEARDAVIEELNKHGVTPEDLSIDILDRRRKRRSRTINPDSTKDNEFF
jgi:hypothetical protein